MLNSAFLSDFKQTLYRVNVVFLVKVINLRGPFNSFVNACRKNKALATLKHFLYFIIVHFKIIAIFNLHFRRQNRTLRKRRQSNRSYLVASFNKFCRTLTAEQSRAAYHTNFHIYPPLTDEHRSPLKFKNCISLLLRHAFHRSVR